MPNPLFQQLNQNNGGGMNNPLQMIQKFNDLRQNPQQFIQYLLDSGRIPPQMQNAIRQNINDPYQIVQSLLTNGIMNKQEFDKYSQFASEFQKLVK